MLAKLKNNSLLVILSSIVFSLLCSNDGSKEFYQKIKINGYYGSLLLDVLINVSLAFVILNMVSKLNFFEYYRKFMLNHFSLKTGNIITGIVYLIILFSFLLVLELLIEPEYITSFLGYHLLFVWIFLIDNVMNAGRTREAGRKE